MVITKDKGDGLSEWHLPKTKVMDLVNGTYQRQRDGLSEWHLPKTKGMDLVNGTYQRQR